MYTLWAIDVTASATHSHYPTVKAAIDLLNASKGFPTKWSELLEFSCRVWGGIIRKGAEDHDWENHREQMTGASGSSWTLH